MKRQGYICLFISVLLGIGFLGYERENKRQIENQVSDNRTSVVSRSKIRHRNVYVICSFIIHLIGWW